MPQASQVSASPNTTSHSNSHSRSHLSLKGPGTSLADDSEEINLPVDSEELDSDPQGLSNPPAYLTPPSRLLLQLVGLIENSVRRSRLLVTQLKGLWFDELAGMFARLETQSKNMASMTETKRFIEWMGSRVMREFQVSILLNYRK